MKALLVGIGSFGYGWYQTIKKNYPSLQLVVADRNPELAARLLDPPIPFYTDVVQALDLEQPDFLINLTPPAVHTAVNHLAFDRRIPVLCEKPISEDFHEAEEIVHRAEQEKILFMIAENYRRMPPFRKARQLIELGAIGEISAIYVQFFKEAYIEKEYLVKMPDPLLMDVTVHHFDLARYLTASNGARIFAHSFNPKGSRYPGNSALDFILEMQDGSVVTYAGSMSSKEAETGWPGDWRIEGRDGVLLVNEQEVRVVGGSEGTRTTKISDVEPSSVLDEFLSALAARRQPETSGMDYLHTQKLVHYARLSSKEKKMLEIL